MHDLALKSPGKDYAVFIHLLDQQENCVAQSDSTPVSGIRPTSGWELGEVVVDPHLLPLPSELAEGEYALITGMYDSDGKRPSDGSGQNYIALKRMRLGR